MAEAGEEFIGPENTAQDHKRPSWSSQNHPHQQYQLLDSLLLLGLPRGTPAPQDQSRWVLSYNQQQQMCMSHSDTAELLLTQWCCWNGAGGGFVQPTRHCCFPQHFPSASRHWWFRHTYCPSYASETLQQVRRLQVTQDSPQRLSQTLSLSNSIDEVRQTDQSMHSISYAEGPFLKRISCW